MLPILSLPSQEMNPVTTNLISDEETLTAILNSTGKPVDAAQVKAVVEKLKGKQIHDVQILIIIAYLKRSIQGWISWRRIWRTC